MGLNVDEARQNLEDAKREYLAALVDQRLVIPSPSTPVVAVVTWSVVTTPSNPPEAPGRRSP